MSPRARIAGWLVVTSLAFQSCFITLDAFHSDEGLVMVAAADVAAGRTLYRDCYVPVTPAVYWLLGFAFKLFGSDFLVARALLAVVYAASVAAVFAIAAAFLPLRRACVAGLLAIPLQLWMWPHAHFLSYNALATLLCVLAIALAGSHAAAPRRLGVAAGLGASLAAALWTKPNLALATGAGVLLYWISVWARSAVGAAPPRVHTGIELLRSGVAVLGAGLALSAPPLVFLIATGSLGAMLDSLVALGRIYGDVPTGIFPAPLPLTGQLDSVRLNPGLVVPGVISSASWEHPTVRYLLDHTGWIDLWVRLVYYAPIALLLALALCFALRLARRRWTWEDEAALVPFFAGSLLYLTIVPHPAMHYMVPTLLPLLPLAVYLEWRTGAALRPPARIAIRLAGAALLALYAAGSVAALGLYLSVDRAPVPSAAGTLWLPRTTAELWNEILDYTRTQVPEGERIFAYPYFPILYFLSAHDHASRFVDLRPGSPGAGSEDEIIDALERERVRFVFHFPGAAYSGIEPWPQAYPRLHHYLETRFERLREFRSAAGVYAEVRGRRDTSHADAAQAGEER